MIEQPLSGNGLPNTHIIGNAGHDIVTGAKTVNDNQGRIGGDHNSGVQVESIGGNYHEGDVINVGVLASDELAVLMKDLPIPFQLQLPSPHFIGREAQIQQLYTYLTADESQPRITGMFGLGGIGKTSISKQLLARLKVRFPDGILWADLDRSTPDEVLISFATAYGQSELINKLPDLSSRATFVHDLLDDKRILIVLDHAASSSQVEHLLPNGPNNRTLITSRNKKMLDRLDANLMLIPPFSETEGLAYLEALIGVERVQEEYKNARRLVSQVGGIPLALTIVGGFINEAFDLTLGEYCEMLEDEQTRFENLTDWEDTSRDVSATFELSYQTLSPPSQKLFGILSIFDGPDISVKAISDVAQLPVGHVKIALGQLSSMSLIEEGLGERQALIKLDNLDDSGRCRINTLLKVFAKQKCGDDLYTYKERAASHFVALAVQNKMPANFDILDLDWLNIVSALYWANENERYDLLIQGTLALTHHWIGLMGFLEARGHWLEALELLQLCLDSFDQISDQFNAQLVKATLYTRLGGFQIQQSDYESATPNLTSALELLIEMDSLESKEVAAYVYSFIGQSYRERDREKGLEWIMRSLEQIMSTTGDSILYQKAYLKVKAAEFQTRLGQYAEARQAVEEGLQMLPAEAITARVTGLTVLGSISQFMGDVQSSIRYAEQSLPLAKTLGDVQRLGILRLNIGLNEKRQGLLIEAIQSYQKALHIFEYTGNSTYQSGVSLNLGQIYITLGHDVLAQHFLERSITLAINKSIFSIEALARSKKVDLAIMNQAYEEALIQLEKANTICIQLKMTSLEATLWRQRAQISLGIGNISEALNHTNKALSIAVSQQDRLEEGVVWRVRGQIFSKQKNIVALFAFEKSLDLLEHEQYETALTKLELARYDQKRKWASNYLKDANMIFENLGAQRELKIIKETF